MKLKNVSLAMTTGVMAVSLFALTSCSEKESVEILSYSNEITGEKFTEAVGKYYEGIDLTGGYENTTYEYSNADCKGEYERKTEFISKETEKYDAVNNILYRSVAVDKSSDDYRGTMVGKGKDEHQIQSDNKYIYNIDLSKNVYTRYESDYDAKEMSREKLYITDLFYNARNSIENFASELVKTKYFNDNDVYTIEYSTDTESKNKYNDEQTGEIKCKNETDCKIVLQFYIKDDTFYFAYDGELNGTITYTKGDKSDVKFDGSEKVSGYTKVVMKAQTIEKLDLSKYGLFDDIFNYM